jgi:pyruvate dehydrogenase E2 component (dihydrolipoamide acetyltransferase)
MTMQTSIIMPDLGIDDQPIRLSSWFVKRGTTIVEGEPVLEVLCGGVTVDLPAPCGGSIVDRLAAEDETIEIGQKLAIIEM